MFENIEEYYYPKSIPDAIKRMNNNPPGTVVPFTGSYHFVFPKLFSAKSLMDISKLGLDSILIEKSKVRLGGTASLQSMVESKELAKVADGIINKSAHIYWSKLQRNMTNLQDIISIGITYFDLLTALTALDAQIILQGKTKRTIPVNQAFTGLYKSVVENELVKEVFFKIPSGNVFSSIQRVGITDADVSILSVVTLIKMKGRKCSFARIAAGSGLPCPTRIPSLEEELMGTTFNEISINSISQKIRGKIEPISDIRGSSDYRKEICGVLVRRALMECYQKAEGEK